MARTKGPDPKAQALRARGTLHGRPQDVTDELFRESDFFDPRDLVQVRYEMLRRVRVEDQAIARAARAFGFSRPSFYQAQVAFEHAGLAGLLPAKRGPRRAHKLSEAVMRYLVHALDEDPSLAPSALARRIQERFGISVHPRSVERALKRRGKKTAP